MNKWLFLPISFFVLGLIFLVYGLLIDEVSVGIAVFIPFVMSDGLFGFFGIMCMFFSMISLFLILPKLSLGFYTGSEADYEIKDLKSSSERKARIGGVIFLGPIPFIFGSNKKITKYMILASIIILILILLYASLLLNE
jgi:uncharacterized protein (TIGR00304 family)